MKPRPQVIADIHAALKEEEPSSSEEGAGVGSTDGWLPETGHKEAKSNKIFIVISLIISAVLILVVVGVLLRHNNLQVQARANYDSEIAQIWKEHQLVLSDTRRLLEEQSDLESGKELLESHVAFFKGMKQLLQQPGTPVQLSLPSENQDELRALQKLLEEWAGLHEKPWASLQPSKTKDSASDILVAYRNWQDSRTATWKQLTAYINFNIVPPPADDLVQSLKDKAKEMLRHSEPARGSVTNWKQVFQLQGHPNSPVDPEVQHWLKLWTELDGPDVSASAEAQKAFADNSLPDWLRAKSAALKQRQDQEKAGQMAENNNQAEDKHAKEAQKPQTAIEDADSMTATNAICICLLQPGEDPAGRITELKVSAGMQLYVGHAWDAHPRPDAKTEPKDGGLKKWLAISLDGKEELKFGPTLFAKLTEMIIFSKDGALTAISEELRSSTDGVRIVARSHDGLHVLFDLRLIPISKVASSPIFTQVIETTVDNADAVTLSLPAGFLSRLHFVGQQDNVYSLRLNGAAADQKFYALTSAGDSALQVMPPQKKGSTVLNRAAIENQIKDLEAGILYDEKLLAENETKKMSPRIKDANRETYTKGKADKEIRLQDLRAQLQSLETPLPLHFDLLPGSYTLLLEQPAKIELCRLKVVQAASPSQSKPTHP